MATPQGRHLMVWFADGSRLRVDQAALELSRREGKQAEEQCDKFGLYDCSDVSGIICMFKNRFIPGSDWILFAGK